MVRWTVQFALCGLLSLLLAPLLLASEGPSIETVELPAIERGTSAGLKIVGANLATAREVLFYQPGVACESIAATNGEELQLRLKVTDDCATGRHVFRVRTDAGFSELRTFTVTPYPVVSNSDSNELVTLGSSVIGNLNDKQTDRYTIALQSDQRLSIDVEAIRLGIDMIDAAITVRDPAGNIVSQVDDSSLYHQDPITSIVAKQSGNYIIEISDAGRSASEQAVYVMHLSDGPRPLSVFPLGGQAGTELELKYQGDCRGPWVQRQALPVGVAASATATAAATDSDSDSDAIFQLFAEQDGKRSATPIPFRLSTLANVLERARNDDWLSVAETQAVEVPIALNGVIEQALDRDCFWLRGIPGQALDVDVFACRLGSAADTWLTIIDAQQDVVAQSDDVDSLDSRLTVVVPQDGRFGIEVNEKRGKGGAEFTYRIEIQPSRPSAEAFLPRRDRLSQNMQTIAVPQGNRVLALMAVRKDDATGETTVRFPELLPGTKTYYSQPRADQAIVPVVFEASSDAALAGKLIPVEVSVLSPAGTASGQFHQVTDLVRGPADAIYTEHNADKLALCTREPYPVSISVNQPQAALLQDGTLDLVVNIQRQTGFEGDVILSLPWLPAWIDADTRIIVPAGQSQATIRLRAWKQAEAATWPIVVEASAQPAARKRRSRADASGAGGGGGAGGGAGNMPGGEPPSTGLLTQAVASVPIELSIEAPPAIAKFEVAAAEQGQELEIICTLEAVEKLQSITGLVATLEGLPNRVQCAPIKLESKSQVIRFKVALQSTAPVGRYVGLTCRLSGMLGGEAVSSVISRDGELTIELPGQVMRDENGRPLNRVEALRKRIGPGKRKTDAS